MAIHTWALFVCGHSHMGPACAEVRASERRYTQRPAILFPTCMACREAYRPIAGALRHHLTMVNAVCLFISVRYFF